MNENSEENPQYLNSVEAETENLQGVNPANQIIPPSPVTPSNPNLIENEAIPVPYINPELEVLDIHKKKKRKNLILFTIIVGFCIFFWWRAQEQPEVELNEGRGYISRENSDSTSAKTNASTRTSAETAKSVPNSNAASSGSTETLSGTAETIAVSKRVVPREPASDSLDGQLPSGKVIFKIGLDLQLDENTLNEKDPNQKDFRSYKYRSQNGIMPLIYIDRWDKEAPGANQSEAAQFGKDESSFKSYLKRIKVDFIEENIVINNEKATLIFVGKTAEDMAFYCSVIQTYKGEFYSFTFTPQSKKTVDDDLKVFEKFLGSIKYQ